MSAQPPDDASSEPPEIDPTDSAEGWQSSFGRDDPEPAMPARARTLEHMRHLLLGATATLALGGCSSGDAPKLDAKGSGSAGPGPSPSVSIATSNATASESSLATASALPIAPSAEPSASAAPSASGPPRDAGAPVPKPPTVRHPTRRSSGYEVVDMLPPPPFFFRRKRKQKKEPRT